MISSDKHFLNRLSVILRKADQYIEEWVLHFVDQIEEENNRRHNHTNKNKHSS